MAQSQEQDKRPTVEMSLGDHIEELRSHILKALMWIGLAVTICLFFQDPLMKFVVGPHTKAMSNIVDQRAPNPRFTVLEKALKEFSTQVDTSQKDKEALVTVLSELTKYLQAQEKEQRKAPMKLKVMKYQSGFLAYIKVCIICGIFFGAPLAMYQIWKFVADGLYPHEQKYVLIFAPFTFIAFLGGIAFGYYILIPIGLEYLGTFASPEIAENFISIDWYLSLFFALTIALGAVFELPLVMLFVAKLGIMTAKDFAAYWKYTLLIGVIFGAVLTPPDPVTQVLLAGPIMLLYGLGIALCYFFHKPREIPEDLNEGDSDKSYEWSDSEK